MVNGGRYAVRAKDLQSGSLLEIDNIPESWVPQQKYHCLFSGLWPRVYQRGAGIPISFHSWEWKSLIPLPELWQFVFSFPSKSLILEIDFFYSLSVPDFREWYDCTWVPPLCSRKSFPSLTSEAEKGFRLWQDSNLQSPDPKSGALSIRPHSPT